MLQSKILNFQISKRKAVVLTLTIVLAEVLVIAFPAVLISNKNDVINSRNNEISSLRDKITTAENKTGEKQAKLNEIAFAVHPESDYAEFRKKAFIKLFQERYPDVVFNENDMLLVRVFNTTSFRNADPLFAPIQNDDILIFDGRLAKNNEKIPVAIIRPREQKAVVSELISAQSIALARSGNKSQSIFGPTPNYFSQQ